MNKMTALILTLISGLLFAGCQAEQTEKDMIAEAQFCLDKATNGTSANACLAKINGLTSPQAYALRCAGGFIEAQIATPEKLSQALNAISANGGTSTLLSSLSFGSTTLANKTFTNCVASKQEGLQLIGAMAKSATILTTAASSLGSCSTGTCSSDEIKSTLTNLQTQVNANDPAAQETVLAIVTSVQTVYTTTCGDNFTGSDICKQIDSAVAGTPYSITTTDNSQLLAIGLGLLSQWKQ